MTIQFKINSDDPLIAYKYQQLLHTERAEILANGGNLQDFLNSSVYKSIIRDIARMQSIHEL